MIPDLRDAGATPDSPIPQPDRRLSQTMRFEDLARRIVNVPRQDVQPVKHAPRPKPPAA